MKEYRITYSTHYVAKCSRQVWKEPPEGLQYAHIGRVKKTRDKTMVPVVGICEIDGKRFRKTKNVFLNSQGIKNLRLSLVEKPS